MAQSARSFAHSSGDVSRPLQWGGIPDGTVELVLLVDDPDAPIKGSFVPWVLFRIAPSRSGFAEGESPAEAQRPLTASAGLDTSGPRRLPAIRRTTMSSGYSPSTL